MKEKRNAHRVLIGQPEATKPLGRHGCSWEDIKIELNRMGHGIH
jgi:hypothetical protein